MKHLLVVLLSLPIAVVVAGVIYEWRAGPHPMDGHPMAGPR